MSPDTPPALPPPTSCSSSKPISLISTPRRRGAGFKPERISDLPGVPAPRRLGRERCGVRRNINEILFRQLRHDRLHQIGPHAIARADLHVEHLARAVTRRPSSKAGHRSQPFQISAVTNRARRRPAAAGLDERFSLFDGARPAHRRRSPSADRAAPRARCLRASR